jgi:putative endonuclease
MSTHAAHTPDELAEENHAPTPWWVYLLRCVDGSLYTGIATDVDRRAAEHNAGTGAKYTRSRKPVEVVYREQLPDKSSALKREAAVKKLSHTQKIALIQLDATEERRV